MPRFFARDDEGKRMTTMADRDGVIWYDGKMVPWRNATTHVLGVRTVTLELTNQAGRPLGATDTFPIRAEAVSRVIWVIIGAGVVLLFGAIAVRLVRRVRRSQAS